MALDKKDIEKLSPEERIEKLKELKKKIEDERKKDLVEIGSLIKKSMAEMRTDKLADKIAPRQREIEISSLFERTNDNDNGLEREARKAKSSPGGSNYQASAQVYQDYSKLKQLYGMVSTGNSLTQEQINAIGVIGERLHVVEKYVTESEKLSSVLDTSKQILYKLKKETGL